MCFNPFSIKVFNNKEFTCAVNHRLCLAVFVDKLERRDIVQFAHAVIIGSEGRGDMHYACTIFCCDEVARNDTEGVTIRCDPRDKLLIIKANEVFTFTSAEHLIRKFLVSHLKVLKRRLLFFRREEGVHEWFS